MTFLLFSGAALRRLQRSRGKKRPFSFKRLRHSARRPDRSFSTATSANLSQLSTKVQHFGSAIFSAPTCTGVAALDSFAEKINVQLPASARALGGADHARGLSFTCTDRLRRRASINSAWLVCSTGGGSSEPAESAQLGKAAALLAPLQGHSTLRRSHGCVTIVDETGQKSEVPGANCARTRAPPGAQSRSIRPCSK